MMLKGWQVDPRVCEVAALPSVDAAKGSLGTGLLLGSGRVLTARHVVDPDSFEAKAWKVRPIGTADWLKAQQPVCAKTGDIAVLSVPAGGELLPSGVDPPRLGRLAGADELTARTVGFPDARRTRASQGGLPIGDPEQVRGELRPATQAKGGLLSLHLWGATPTWAAYAGSPWEGMSGAGVFHGPWLVGVVSVDPANFAGDRLEVATLASLGFDDPLWSALEIEPGELEVADRPSGLIEPYGGAPPTRSARMLQSRYGLVPFRGREQELANLCDWCERTGQLGLGLVTGAGGQGKTRLAAELCDQVVARGWLAGFVTPHTYPGRLSDVLQKDGPKLLVVDDADGRVEQVLTIAEDAAASPGRVRLLLLARYMGRWWDSLPYRASRPEPFDEALTFVLAPVALGREARRAAYDEAVSALARHLGRREPAKGPDLVDPLFARLLFVHLAALTAVDPELPAPPGTVPKVAHRLLDDILLREDVKHWEPAAAKVGAAAAVADAATRQQAVAVATLTAADQSSAPGLLQALPLMDPAGTGPTAQWLHALNPSGTGPYLPPLEPDRLGEHLTATVIAQLPELCSDLALAGRFDHVGQMLNVLTRGARAYPALRCALRKLLTAHAKSLLDAIATAGDLSSAQVVAEAIDLLTDQDLSRLILKQIPEKTYMLLDVSIAANQTLLKSAIGPPERARLLTNLSTRLAGLGRREDALAAIDEAVGLFRQLVVDRPEAFTPNLARSLHTLSGMQAALGRREDALAAIDEAVDLRRQLVVDAPEAFTPDLARSLNNLSNRLADLGRHDIALTASHEAVGLFRQLVVDRAETFTPNLATSLHTLSGMQAALGRREDALAAIDEAVALFRQLVVHRAEAFTPDLASSLTSLSNRLADLGRHDIALTAIDEAVGLFRQLVVDRAEAFTPNLARSLHTLSGMQAALGRREDALAAIDEAVALFRQLVVHRAEAFTPDFASSLTSLSNRLADLGRHDIALTASHEAATRALPLLERSPLPFLESGTRILKTYESRCADLGVQPEGQLVKGLRAAIGAASVHMGGVEVAAKRDS
jgi:tetratricopeptide (TPR) repeat protein